MSSLFPVFRNADPYALFGQIEDFPRWLERTSDEWSPAADVEETDSCYRISMDVPGFSADDLEVEAHQQVLSIRGTLTDSGESTDSEDTAVRVHRRERRTRNFMRSFRLPLEVDPDSVKAQVRNGVLIVEVPRAASGKARRSVPVIAAEDG